jgi:FAD/FMN-containing dehydrogenase
MRNRGRWVWSGVLVGGLVVATLGGPSLHLALTKLRDRRDRPAPPPGFIDDASGLDQTRIAAVWDIPANPVSAERQLVALVQRARAEGLAISIAGARHSMGGHSIQRDGIVLNMRPFHAMQLDDAGNILHVQAGALWSEVVPYLNTRGRSVAVMQSNNSFSVGGSVSVNCHGWQASRPPIASTVESFRILKADGSIVRCSRAENDELFSLALGGYGLFGVILDVDLRVVPNEEYRLERLVMPGDQFVAAVQRRVGHGEDVGMAFGRLSVAPESFLREAILNVFHRIPSGAGKPSPVSFPELAGLTRAVFRGQVGSDYGKSLRWQAEKRLEGALSHGPICRNQLLGEPAEVFENRSRDSTDILHEYFVALESFDAFVDQLRLIIPKHKGDLLNVTVRDVLRDDDTFLRYADRDMLGVVMLFNQPRTVEGEAMMEAMTGDLIDAALRLGGRYYLPYRLHATREQFVNAYSQASRFFQLKQRYDPQLVFQNLFYQKYGAVDATRQGSGRR